MSKKKELKKQKKQQPKQSNKQLYIAISAVIFVLVIGFFAYAWWTQQSGGKLWSLDSNNKLSFSDRGSIQVDSDTVGESTSNYTLENVSFKSFGDEVYASLVKPKNVTNPPVVIVLPAMTMTKEMNEPTAEALIRMGYASLTLDMRGWGQTGGENEGDWQKGYKEYLNGSDPIQYKQVYDALKAFDYVRSRSDLDGNDVAIMGESIGGMWAIVAAGEESRLKGVVTISSCDFGLSGDPKMDNYINSVMPSRYLDGIPPRKLAMFQFDNDTIIPMAQGKALFDKAPQPKAWHLYNGSTHGVWDDKLYADLQSELKGMLGR